MFRFLRPILMISALAVVLPFGLSASEDIPDQYPASALYSKPVEVIPGVWSAIGATAPPTYENWGHNNNLSFIVTGDGVVVVNSGASYQLARALHDEIKAVTDEPVKLVFNENGQGHAVLGNGYWAEQGVPIVAHADAAHEVERFGGSILEAMQRYNRDQAEGTEVLFINFGDQEGLFSLKLANELRDLQVKAEVYPDSSKLRKQMDFANKKNIPYVVLIGSEEMKSGQFTVKHMHSGEQHSLSRIELLQHFTENASSDYGRH